IPGLDNSALAVKLKERCEAIYSAMADAHEKDPVKPVPVGAIQVMTWRERQRTFIGAVEKEIALVLFLFSFISLTAVFLVLSIFFVGGALSSVVGALIPALRAANMDPVRALRFE